MYDIVKRKYMFKKEIIIDLIPKSQNDLFVPRLKEEAILSMIYCAHK